MAGPSTLERYANRLRRNAVAGLRRALPAARRAEPLEFEQLVVRYIIGVFTTSCAIISWYVGALIPSQAAALAIFIPTAWAIAAGFMLHFALWPERRVERRSATITFDAATLSLFIYLGGEAASVFFPVYLWVILGNGFRFGIAYMYASMAVNIGFFAVTALYTPNWRADWAFAAGVLLLLVLIPLYVSRLIRELRSAMAEAEAANRAKSEFLATMSHELRTPLNAIMGLSQVLDKTTRSAHDRLSAMSINSAAARLLEMVDAILDFQRIESRAVTARSEPVDLAQLLHDAESLLRPLARKKGLTLSFRFATPLPERLAGDRDHLKTVLLNLAGNAVKYTDQGRVSIVASYRAEAGQGALRIEVHDTGKGIAQADQPRMFERFVQAADSERGREGGVGLGLALSRSLVELMGGDIGLTSSVGQGSTFWFEVPAEALQDAQQDAQTGEPASFTGAEIALLLPEPERARIASALTAAGLIVISDIRNPRDFVKARAASGDLWRHVLVVDETELDARALSDIRHALRDAPIPPALVASSESETIAESANARLAGLGDAALIATVARWHAPKPGVPASSRPHDAGTAPRTVLVADDNPFNREVAKKLLALDGHKVVLASNGEEALDTLLRGAVDLAFLDINMPLGNGIEVCKDYRLTIGPQAHIPIVAMTADTSRTTREACRRAGMATVLHKPVQLDELRETIRVHAGQGHPAAAGAAMHSASQPEAENAPRLDTRRVDELEALFGTESFRHNLLGLFETDFERNLDALSEAIKDGATARAYDALHALKSCANTIGAARLAGMCEHDRDAPSPLDAISAARIASEYALVRAALDDRLDRAGDRCDLVAPSAQPVRHAN